MLWMTGSEADAVITYAEGPSVPRTPPPWTQPPTGWGSGNNRNDSYERRRTPTPAASRWLYLVTVMKMALRASRRTSAFLLSG